MVFLTPSDADTLLVLIEAVDGAPSLAGAAAQAVSALRTLGACDLVALFLNPACADLSIASPSAILPRRWQDDLAAQELAGGARWLPDPHAWALQVQPQTRLTPAVAAFVPLISGAVGGAPPQVRILGRALLCWRDPPAAPPALAWLTVLGHWIGAALARHACAAELQRTQNEIATLKATLDVRNARWSALYNTAVLLMQQLYDEHVLEEIVRRSIQLLEADRGALLERDPAGAGLRITIAFWRDGRPDIALDRRIAAGEGLSGRVFQAGQPMMVANYSRWPEQVADVDGAALRAAAAAPLFGRQGVIGVLTVASTAEGKRFTEDDVQILTLFAQQAAAVLEHTHARRQAEALLLSEERARLARELHDGLVQDVAALLLRADLCWELADDGNLPLRDALETLATGLQRSIRGARAAIHALHPPALEDHSLEDALRLLLTRFEVEAHPEIQFCVVGGGRWQLQEQHKAGLLRLAREALHNVGKHAAATEIAVELTHLDGGEVRLSVRDNGCGFDPAAILTHGQESPFGLTSLREQVAALGGRFGVESAPGHGTTVWATLPVAGGIGENTPADR
jgi:signal transduction histidine kinase